MFFLQKFLKNTKKIAKSLDMGGHYYNKNVAKLGRSAKNFQKVFTDNNNIAKCVLNFVHTKETKKEKK